MSMEKEACRAVRPNSIGPLVDADDDCTNTSPHAAIVKLVAVFVRRGISTRSEEYLRNTQRGESPETNRASIGGVRRPDVVGAFAWTCSVQVSDADETFSLEALPDDAL
jgi:hypothetical protein